MADKQKVLICDDEEGVRESLKLILSDHYDLIITESGEQCLQCLANAKDIGLVLVDIKMPMLDGLKTLTQIRKINRSVKVIVVTGYSFVDTANEALRLGANGYVIKPFKASEILSTVQSTLSEPKDK